MFGTVQDYLSQHQLAHYSVSQIGWITAMLLFLALFFGVRVGPLFDRYEPKMLLAADSLASFSAYILLAEYFKYWHFMLCLGIFSGSAAAVVTTVSISAFSHWFYRRRARC